MPALDTWLWAAGIVCVFGGIAVAWVLVRGGARLPVVMGLRDPEPDDMFAMFDVPTSFRDMEMVRAPKPLIWYGEPRTTPPIARRDEFGTGTPEHDALQIEFWLRENQP